jgi:hypothetical protein
MEFAQSITSFRAACCISLRNCQVNLGDGYIGKSVKPRGTRTTPDSLPERRGFRQESCRCHLPIGGGGVVDERNGVGARSTDIEVTVQHIEFAARNMQTAGQLLLGLEAETERILTNPVERNGLSHGNHRPIRGYSSLRTDAGPHVLVDLVEADFLAFRRRRKNGHGAGDQGKA